jgi:hypothetical protein
MNKREALNLKIYCLAPQLHSKMPVGRLIQKGSRMRHLAAEACTTTVPPTREQFQFLLGLPSCVCVYIYMCVCVCVCVKLGFLCRYGTRH